MRCAVVPISCNHFSARPVIASFCFLVAVAICKTVLTKYIFENLRAPVAMSALSCIVTALLILPINPYTGQFRVIRVDELATFSAVCAAVSADLAFTNIGLSILPLAFTQSIKSTLPIATIAIDFLINRYCVSCRVFTVVIGICIGPIILSLDKDWNADGEMLYGVMMLILSTVAGALKYVLAHSAIKRYKNSMGVLGFTFWMEVFALLLVPWSVINGEARLVWVSTTNWGLLVGTGAFGGVRVLSQFYFLEATSATSLAASTIAIQVGLMLSGSFFFHDPVTVPLIVGSLITFLMSASYVYLKANEDANVRLELLPQNDVAHRQPGDK